MPPGRGPPGLGFPDVEPGFTDGGDGVGSTLGAGWAVGVAVSGAGFSPVGADVWMPCFASASLTALMIAALFVSAVIVPRMPVTMPRMPRINPIVARPLPVRAPPDAAMCDRMQAGLHQERRS